MSIEKLIERIAVAGERQAAALEGMLSLQTGVAQAAVIEEEKYGADQASDTNKDAEELSYAAQRKAEVAAEAKAKKEAEKADAVKKKPGRPPKAVEPVKEEAKAPVVEEEDPFADAPAEVAEVKVDMDTVRNVLVELRKFCIAKLGDGPGKEKAYSVLRDAGGGASYLKGSTAGGATPGGPGELKEANYAAVYKAARKVIDAG